MSSKTRKMITLLAAIVMIASLIAGCQPAAAPAPVAEQPCRTGRRSCRAGEEVVQEEPAAPAAEAFKLVWYVPAPHPYFEEVRGGVEACEKELNIEVQYQVGPDWQQNSQNQNMEALAAKGYKYFSVYPSDASGANSLYEELVANGASIVNFGTSTLLPTTASFAVATDVKVAAMQATEELIKAMGGKGNIINVLEVLEDPNTVLRKQGIEEVVAKYDGVTIIQEVSGMTTVEAALEKINSALSANLDKVDGIVTTGYTPTVALSQVLREYKEKGGEREIHGVGIDTDEITMQAIRDGVLDGTIVQNPYGHGYLSCLLLNYLHEGYTPKADAYFVNGGFVYANAANIDTYSADIEVATQEIKSVLLETYLTK
jgi:ribose transport system substrate-binding protein